MEAAANESASRRRRTVREIDPTRMIEPAAYAEHGYPHDDWTWLRENAPVRQFEAPGWPPFWAITKHADIVEISKDPELFLNEPGMTMTRTEVLEQTGGAAPPIKTIINMDPPEHRKFRQVASPYFTPRALSKLQPLIDQTARELVDELGREGECDFISTIASIHPLKIIARILGVPESDEPFILKLTNELFGSEDPEFKRDQDRREHTIGLFKEFWEYFGKVMTDRRENPTDDLASVFANAVVDGEPMGELETMGYCLIAFTAGHETTRGSIGGGLDVLMQSRDQLDLWGRKPEITPSAIEEIVRVVTPVNTMVRTASRDCVFRDQKVREGDRLVLFYASANRDADVFEAPNELRLERRPNRHLGFGIGEHYCLGANLAKMTSGTLFRELTGRLEEVELTGPTQRTASNLVPGIKHMPIRYRLKPAS
jgi:cytochrome P450